MREGIPFIIAAPSGAGKTSLVKALADQDPNLKISISYTTRPKRPGETEHVDYHFIAQAEFQALQEKNAFLESAQVFTHSYGTGADWVNAQLAKGMDVLFDIDWQGAQQLRKKLPQSTSIFILPPSLQILQQRLSGRGQDNDEVIQHRMMQAQSELSHYPEFDYLVVNIDFEHALADLKTIIASHRLKLRPQKQALAPLLTDLLA